MKKTLVRFLSLLLTVGALALPLDNLAQNGALFMQHYSARDFSTQSSVVWDIAQDATGAMLFANNAGVLVYDGARWLQTPTTTPARSLAKGPNGKLFVGCISDFGALEITGTYRVQYRSYKKFLRDKSAVGWIDKTFSIGDDVYYYSDQSIFRVSPSKQSLERITTPDKVDAKFWGAAQVENEVYVYRSGDGDHGGLCKLQGKNVVPAAQAGSYVSEEIKKACRLTASRHIFVAGDNQIYLLDGSNLVSLGTPAPGNVTAVGRVSDERIAVGTSDGVYIVGLRGNLIQKIDAASGLPSTNIYSLYTDNQNGLWVGHAKGVSRVALNPDFISYRALASTFGRINDLAFYNGQVFVASANGLFIVSNGQASLVSGVSSETSQLQEVSGRLLAAGFGGLFDVSSGSATAIPLGAENPQAFDVSVSATQGKAYVAQQQGVSVIQWGGGGWSVTSTIALPNAQTNSVAEGAGGQLWIGTTANGLAKAQAGGQPQYIGKEQGFVDGKIKVRKAGDQILFLHNDQGYFALAGDKFSPVQTPAELKTQSFYADFQVDDKSKKLFFFTPNGLRVGRYDALKLSVDSVSAAYFRHETPTAVVLSGDQLWAAYTDELILIRNANQPPAANPFEPLVRTLSFSADSALVGGFFSDAEAGVYGFRQPEGATVKMDYSANSFTVELGATAFDNPLGNEYQYRLKGQSDEWSVWTRQSSLNFTNLSEGGYALEVRARNCFGQVSPTVAVMKFSISPPWYRTIYMYFVYGFAAIGLFFVFLKVNSRRLEAANRRLEGTVAERTKEIQAQKNQLNEQNAKLDAQNNQLEKALVDLKSSQGEVARQRDELQQSNVLLQQNVEELKRSKQHIEQQQQKLIQSEKMAALGQLIAGVAHEVNTPLGAIRASIGIITDSMHETVGQLPTVLKMMNDAELALFMEMFQRSLAVTGELSSREERKIKKDITAELEAAGLDKASRIADKLVDMRIYDGIGHFMPLFVKEESPLILKMCDNLTVQQRSSQNIQMAVDKASKVVFALKNYARFDHSGEKVEADITMGLETVLTLYNNQIKQGIEVNRYYEDIPKIMCFPDELNQVWTNLIHNAIQAMNNKGTLDVSIKKQDTFVVVQVRDYGVGIPPEIMERIFDPFFTTKAAGEGSGLGLDIVRKIIEKHNGKIEVQSQPGNTVFSVYLPIK